MIEQVKQLRVKIDSLSQLVKGLEPFYKEGVPENLYKYSLTPELQKSYDSLILAKAWLGKVLQALDVPTPYKNDGKRHDVASIEPTADTVGINLNFDSAYNHIEKVDWLRQEIQKVTEKVNLLDCEIPTIRFNNEIVYKYLCEARFWLGFELQRIRENSIWKS